MVSRAEHRRNTLTLLGQAAVELFEIHGTSVTIDTIAARAGMSRRTVFRYVDAKEELAFLQPILWLDVFDAAIENDKEAPIRSRLFAAAAAIARHIDQNPDPVRRAFALTYRHPELARGYATVFHRWINRIAEEVLKDLSTGADAASGADLSARFQARIIGSATMGVIDAVTIEWISASSHTKFLPLLNEAFALLQPLWEQFPNPLPTQEQPNNG